MILSTAGAAADKTRVARALDDLRSWLPDNLVENERAGEPDEDGAPRKALRLRRRRMTRWAFISWNTEKRS